MSDLKFRNLRLYFFNNDHKKLIMKIYLILISIVIFSHLIVNAQSEATVTIVSCKDGNLIIDGHNIGKIEANDATQQNLSYGEHYIQ